MGLLKRRELVLIIGPCGVGKTTYARAHYPQHAQPDYEALVRTLSADGRLHFYAPFRATGRRLLDTAVTDLLARGIAVCLPEAGATRSMRGHWVTQASGVGASVAAVRLIAPQAACVARAQADPTRPATSRACWPAIIAHWYRDYEPVDAAAEGLASYVEVDVL